MNSLRKLKCSLIALCVYTYALPSMANTITYPEMNIPLIESQISNGNINVSEVNILNPFYTSNVPNAMYINGDYGNVTAYATLGGQFDYDEFTVSLNFFAEEGVGASTSYSTKDADVYVEAEDSSYKDWVNPNNSIIVGGTSYRWFSLRVNSGKLELTLNNQSDNFLTELPVNNSTWNHIVTAVDVPNKQVRILLNGSEYSIIQLPLDFKFDVKEAGVQDKSLGFVNYSNGDVFKGFANKVEAFDIPFNLSQMLNNYNENKL